MCEITSENHLLLEELPVTKIWMDGRYRALVNFQDASIHLKSGDRLTFEEFQQLADFLKEGRS
jgi:hypothetical protein